MKKIELIILALILVGIIVGDIILYKVHNKVEETRTTLIMENMYNKNDIISEIQTLTRSID